MVENAHDPVEHDEQDRQHDERRFGTAGQHAVVDLQAVERAGQHQEIDEKRENADGDERDTAFRQRGTQFLHAVFLRSSAQISLSHPSWTVQATKSGQFASPLHGMETFMGACYGYTAITLIMTNNQ